MATMTTYEVYMLQLINRARHDPLGEAQRYGIDLNEGLTPGRLDGTPKPPLAPNELLVDASRAHSTWMLDADVFSHTGVGGSAPKDRMEAAGYSFTGSWSSGENISWSGTTGGLGDLGGFVSQQHRGLFLSPGHRVNILNGTFREIGVGQVTGVFTAAGNDGIVRGFNASMITQSFATSGSARFLSGVVYADANGNGFYDPGEGLGGVTVSLGGVVVTTTQATGLYTVPVADGLHAVRFAGAGGVYETQVTMAGANLQVNALAAQFAQPLPVASIGADRSVSESVVWITYSVTLDTAATAPASVRWSLADGTARVADRDMPGGQGGTLAFAPGQATASFTFVVNGEAHKAEAAESFAVVLGQPAGLTLGDASATVTLLDHFVATPGAALLMTDSKGQGSTPALSPYSGPLSYLDQEFVHLGADGIVLRAAAPNVFLRTGAGADALQVDAGQNVLDAGAGSNFLTGGSGVDSFFLDARDPAAEIWSTVVGLTIGDTITLWGVAAQSHTLQWVENLGADGFKGATMHAMAAGRKTVSLTLAGLSEADRAARLSIQFGTDPGSGSDYMFVFAHG
jgi:Ca2+-binding RTX toxin-like protein